MSLIQDFVCESEAMLPSHFKGNKVLFQEGYQTLVVAQTILLTFNKYEGYVQWNQYYLNTDNLIYIFAVRDDWRPGFSQGHRYHSLFHV